MFLTALRTGLRRGELIALRCGDIQFGATEEDDNRYIFVRRRYVYGRFTSTKSKEPRRVDLAQDLRAVLLQLRDERMREAFEEDRTDISYGLIFRAPGRRRA